MVLCTFECTGFALDALEEVSWDRAEIRSRPEKPTSLAVAARLVPEISLLNTNAGGNRFCVQANRMEEKLSQAPADLSEASKMRAMQMIHLSKSVCDEESHFTGFPDIGNRNEKLVVNAWIVNHLLSQTVALIRQVMPGFDSEEEARLMMSRVRFNDQVWEQTYKPQLAMAYDTLSAANLSHSIIEYQKWAEDLLKYSSSERQSL